MFAVDFNLSFSTQIEGNQCVTLVADPKKILSATADRRPRVASHVHIGKGSAIQCAAQGTAPLDFTKLCAVIRSGHLWHNSGVRQRW